jgi:ubiquitin-conjugating enzyme E2 M
MARPPSKGVRAALELQKRCDDLWTYRDSSVGVFSVSPFERVRSFVNSEVRFAKSEYEKQLAIQRCEKSSAYRHIPDGSTLWFTPPLEVNGDPLHLQFNILVHKEKFPESFWPNCQFLFDAVYSEGYPANPPKVTCKTPIYHSNIDPAGEVCLSLLKSHWVPTPIYGIIEAIHTTLFQDPNGNDPLPNCQEAANLLLTNPTEFRKRTLACAQQNRTFIPGCETSRYQHPNHGIPAFFACFHPLQHDNIPSLMVLQMVTDATKMGSETEALASHQNRTTCQFACCGFTIVSHFCLTSFVWSCSSPMDHRIAFEIRK